MHEMGKHVPIIPVITKADTMTIREAQNYKQEVFGRLQNPNIPHVRGKINTFRFDKETLDRAGMTDVGGSTPPFLVSNGVGEGGRGGGATQQVVKGGALLLTL
jgi:septin 7